MDLAIAELVDVDRDDEDGADRHLLPERRHVDQHRAR